MTRGRYVMRNLTRVVVTGAGEVIFCGGDRPATVRKTDRPDAWSRLLQSLVEPVHSGELLAGKALPPDFDDESLDALVEGGHVLSSDTPALLLDHRVTVLSSAPAFHMRPGMQRCRHLVIGCSGSVVAGIMAQTLLSLRFAGFQQQLDVILTDSATRFLTRDLLEAYGIRCWRDGFERQDGVRVPHVALAAGAELICVLPATANALDRVARSACTDLLSLVITASAAPVVLAPVMNGTMWNNAGVQRNVDRLRADGRYVIEPTVIFGAADFQRDAPPMYGGHGCLWSGPEGLMAALVGVLEAGQAASGSLSAPA